MCVCAAWEQSSVQLFEFKDEQSPGYIAQWLERSLVQIRVCPCVRLVSGLSGNGDSDRSSWSPFKKKIED